VNKKVSRLLIALSAGGKNDELAVNGIGEEHVNELMVRMAMRLLSNGHRLAFGGTMGVAGQDLTENLIDTAQRYLDEKSAAAVDVTKPETWPMVNYSSWPNYETISEEQRARLVGICRFEDISPPGMTKGKISSTIAESKSQAKRHGADALSAMRERSARETDLRIVWGGRIKGAAGWMAGILEEVSFSLKHQKSVLILGGFGGCARLLADFLHKKNAAWPEQLNLSACADPERDALLTDVERQQLQDRMAEAERLVSEFRKAIHSDESVNGLSSKLIRDALLEENSRSVINSAAEAAEQFK